MKDETGESAECTQIPGDREGRPPAPADTPAHPEEDRPASPGYACDETIADEVARRRSRLR